MDNPSTCTDLFNEKVFQNKLAQVRCPADILALQTEVSQTFARWLGDTFKVAQKIFPNAPGPISDLEFPPQNLPHEFFEILAVGDTAKNDITIDAPITSGKLSDLYACLEKMGQAVRYLCMNSSIFHSLRREDACGKNLVAGPDGVTLFGATIFVDAKLPQGQVYVVSADGNMVARAQVGG